MTVEELQVLITANTDSLRKEMNKVQKDLHQIQGETMKANNNMLSAFSFLKKGIVALGIGALIKSIFIDNMDDAISRLDTLNNYPKVMSNLGIAGEDAEASLKRLSDKLIDLPTTLDDAAMSVQRFTSANGNIKASTEMFLALNNAILSGGASTETQKSALEQLSQAYAKGKPDMMEWRTAMTAMPAQLKQVAIAMGYVSADQLGEALRNGKVSMNEFMVKITDLNKHGVNGFESFENQARNSTGGVATSMLNVKTAITRGLADIMNAIGQSNIAGFFKSISQAINNVIPYIVAFIKLMGTGINYITNFFGKTTKKNVDNTSKSLGNLGSSGVSTADGLDKATDSAKKLKKELNGLASFDEMNVLKEQDNSSSGSGDSGSGAGAGDLGAIDLSAFDDLEASVDKSEEILKKMKASLKSFADYINNLGFGGIIEHVKSIGNTLKDIFTDPNVVNAGKRWADNFVTNLKSITTSAIQIGINVVDGFLGSIDKYLLQNSGRIKQYIIDMFNISGRQWNIIGDLGDALAQISNVFTSDTAEQIGADIISMFANPFMSVTTIINEFATDFADLLVRPIVDNVGKIKEALDNILAPVQNFTGTLAEAFTYIGDTLQTLYDEHLAPLMTTLKEGISDTFGKFLDVYNQYIAPFVDRASKKFTELWQTHLKPLWDNIVSFVADVIDNVTAFYEKCLKPLIDWIIQNVVPVIVPIVETIYNTVCDVIGAIADVIGGLITVLKGIINFIVGVFTGDWSKAWNGIKQIFSGIWDAIKGVVSTVWNAIKGIISTVIETIKAKVSVGFNAIKSVISSVFNAIKSTVSSIWNGIWSVIRGVINSIIGGIEKMCNSIVKGLNLILKPLTKVGNSILSAVGIKSFSFSTISTVSLPRLAQGGIIDKPMVAQIGEKGREAVLPLENNTGWIHELATQIADLTAGGDTPKHITINVGNRKLVDTVIDEVKAKEFEQNGELVFNL